jgi:hypothetical protein
MFKNSEKKRKKSLQELNKIDVYTKVPCRNGIK